MTFLINRNKIVLTLAVLVALSACTKVWNDHDKVTDPNLKNNLYQAISLTSNLSKFSAMMAKTGYDKIVSSSKTYTVWAPTDQALQSLDPTVLNDTAKLKLFVGNHISNQTFIEGAATGSQRIQMLNGKYNNVTGSTFDSANIITANQYASNGVFHIIDKFIPRYDNCWEFLQNTLAVPMMKSELLSLNYIYFDSTKATQTGVDPNSGRPIWDSTNGKIPRNHFLDTAANVNDEAGLYTLVLLVDNAYTTELGKILPWFLTSTIDSTTNLSALHLVKDLAFKGLYPLAQLPDTLVSRNGIKVPMVKSAIVATYKTSNGIVYIMNQVNFTKQSKFPSVYIQGALPTRFAADRSSNTFYRIRYDSLTHQDFNDIMITNYNYANYSVAYYKTGMNSMRYNVYWVALNDLQATPLWQQHFAYGTIVNDTAYTVSLPTVTVAYNNFNEVYLGRIFFNSYTNLYYFVFGPTTASSAGNIDALTLDYIRLEPAF